MLSLAHDQEDSGGIAYRGMTLEQGVAQDIEWACRPGAGEPPLP